MKHITALMAFAGGLLAAAPAFACAPLMFTDPATGRTYSADSPEGMARRQADWRARSEVVVLARVEAGRLSSLHEIDYTLTPMVALHGGAVPAGDLAVRWSPGHTCNRFTLGISDTVVAFVGADGAVVGFTVPDQLQDRPADLDAQLREIRRGMIGPVPEAPKQ